MSRFDRNYLLRMLWDMNASQESITGVSKYMGSFPTHVDEIVSIWEEQLSDCFGERKLLFLYVLNDVIQVFRGSEISRQFINKLNTFLYATIRDVPSLVTKAKRLVTVWQSRNILSDFQSSEASRAINSAIDDYHHKKDRRHPNEDQDARQTDFSDKESANSDVENDDSGFDNHDDDGIDQINPAFSEDGFAGSADHSFYENISEEENIKDIQSTDFLEEEQQCLLSDLKQLAKEEEIQFVEVGQARNLASQFPPWVTSTSEFDRMEHELKSDPHRTSDILYRAMEPVMALETRLNELVFKRRAVLELADKIREWKRKRLEVVNAAIQDCDDTLQLIEEINPEGEDMIARVLRREQEVIEPIGSKTSSKAMQIVETTLKKEEEEQQKRKQEEEEQKRKDQEIRDSINREIMRTTAEDLIGKTWNAKSVLSRMF